MKSVVILTGVVLLSVMAAAAQAPPQTVQCRPLSAGEFLGPNDSIVGSGDNTQVCSVVLAKPAPVRTPQTSNTAAAPVTSTPTGNQPATAAIPIVTPNAPTESAAPGSGAPSVTDRPTIEANSMIQGRSPQSLTDDQVREAIARSNGKHHSIGLQLTDQQTAFASAFVAGMNNQQGAVTGFTIVVYSPTQWVELQAALAHREMRPFTVADADDNMRVPMLHVLALPSRAEYISGPGMTYAQGVKRIVLSDTARQTTIQPTDLTSRTVVNSSALRDVSYNSASAMFPMKDVGSLRESDKKGEFFIVVVGDKYNKFFKVKDRDFKFLGM